MNINGRTEGEYNMDVVMPSFAKWREVNKTPHAGMMDFAAFLGDPYPRDATIAINNRYAVNIFNPEIRRKLDMIMGPNGDVMLRIMVIQHEGK